MFSCKKQAKTRYFTLKMRFVHLFVFLSVGKRLFAKNKQNALFYAEIGFYAFLCVFICRKTFFCKKRAKTRYFTLKMSFMQLFAFLCVGERFLAKKNKLKRVILG